MFTLALFTWFLLFLFVYAALFALIILGARAPAHPDTRVFYAALALLAPFPVFFLAVRGMPDGTPPQLERMLVFGLPLLMPYAVRAPFVFRAPIRNALSASRGKP